MMFPKGLVVLSATRDQEALWKVEDDEQEKDSGSSTLALDGESLSEEEGGGGGGFYDLNYDYDNQNDGDYYDNEEEDSNPDVVTTHRTKSFQRDEDLILTEKEDRLFEHTVETEKCILVGVEDLGLARRSSRGSSPSQEPQVYFSLAESMTEMRELLKTAGLSLQAELTQRLDEPNPRTYVGTGKLDEAKRLLERSGCNTIVFDAELTPGQQKALENTLNRQILQDDFYGSAGAEIKVIDRTALILDIFAQHAATRQGKLQVELALHEYRKPRLTRMWTHLERQSGQGGVGLRGPGEAQLEMDKRLLRDRIGVLQKKIVDVQRQRGLHREGRRRQLGLPILALVGYTNAGKSTLLNFLTHAGSLAENILFATLDPTTRRVKLPGYKTHPEVLLTDTVGFIQALPTQLVEAFKATLEEVQEADVLVHVVDVTNPVWKKQEQSVLKTLRTIRAGDKPMVRVLNKIDLLEPDVAERLKYEAACMEEEENENGIAMSTVAVSSTTGDGMEDFVALVEDALGGLLVPIEVEIPFHKGEELNLIHEVGAVDTIDYRETGTYVAGKVPRALANRLKPYYVNEFNSGVKAGSNNDRSSSNKEEEIDWVALGRGRHPKKKDL